METSQSKFTFSFYRFVGSQGNRTTEPVKDMAAADGMRTLVEQNNEVINVCRERVETWATSKGISLKANEPYPSSKHTGKVWLEYRFGGLSL